MYQGFLFVLHAVSSRNQNCPLVRMLHKTVDAI